MKYKIIVVHAKQNYDNYYNCDSEMIQSGLDWKEIEEDKFEVLNSAIQYYNRSNLNKGKYLYIVTEFDYDHDLDLILNDYEIYLQEEKNKKELEIAKVIKQKELNERKLIERKQKQLIKLKKELGEIQ